MAGPQTNTFCHPEPLAPLVIPSPSLPVILSAAKDLLSPLRAARPLGTGSAKDLLSPLPTFPEQIPRRFARAVAIAAFRLRWRAVAASAEAMARRPTSG